MVQPLISSVAPSHRAQPYTSSPTYSRVALRSSSRTHGSAKRGRMEQVGAPSRSSSAFCWWLKLLPCIPLLLSSFSLSSLCADLTRGGGKETNPPGEKQAGGRKVSQQEARTDRHPASCKSAWMDGWISLDLSSPHLSGRSLTAKLTPLPLSLFLPGNWSARGREVWPAERHCQPTKGKRASGIHPGCPPTHLQDSLRPGLWLLRGFSVTGHNRLLTASDHQDHQQVHLQHFLQLHLLQQWWRPSLVHSHCLRQLGEDEWPGLVRPGGVSGPHVQDWVGNGTFGARGGPVQLPVRTSGLGAPPRRHSRPGAPVHSSGDLYTRVHHLHFLLCLHVPRSRHLPHLWRRPPQGQQQQRAVVRLSQLAHAAGPIDTPAAPPTWCSSSERWRGGADHRATEGTGKQSIPRLDLLFFFSLHLLMTM